MERTDAVLEMLKFSMRNTIISFADKYYEPFAMRRVFLFKTRLKFWREFFITLKCIAKSGGFVKTGLKYLRNDFKSEIKNISQTESSITSNNSNTNINKVYIITNLFLENINCDFIKDKNIAFVSLSIDKMEHKDKWLKMIEEEDLKGIQILADKDWSSDFVTAYNIEGIPRFILLDQEGNIVNSNAPRPSDPNLKEVLNTLQL